MLRNAFSLGLNGSIGRKVSFYLNYDLSKIINDADGIFSLPSANYNLKLDRSSANNDQRHRFSAALSWEIRKGIRLSGNYFANSPPPYTITTGLDGNNDTNFNDRPFGTKRNSERGKWKNQFDLSFSWSFSFADKNNQDDGKSFFIKLGKFV